MSKKNFILSMVHSGVGGRILMILAIIGFFVLSVYLSGSKPAKYIDSRGNEYQVVIDNADGEVLTPKETRSDNSAQYPVTIGLIVGTAAILLLVEFGTLIVANRQD